MCFLLRISSATSWACTFLNNDIKCLTEKKTRTNSCYTKVKWRILTLNSLITRTCCSVTNWRCRERSWTVLFKRRKTNWQWLETEDIFSLTSNQNHHLSLTRVLLCSATGWAANPRLWPNSPALSHQPPRPQILNLQAAMTPLSKT